MRALKNSWIRLALLLFVQSLCFGTAQSQSPGGDRFAEEFSKQENIYHDKAQEFVEGYVTDRSLSDYASALPSDFDQSLAHLGPEDRWLDIGAGMGQAILDYYSARYDLMHVEEGKPPGKKARAVAMSIEDRRTVFWDQAAAHLEADQIQYLFNKRLGEYSLEELGRFQVITDVVGGFSYTANLSRFMEKVLDFLALNGNFYTVLQDVRSEDGANEPYYKGAPFLTEIRDANGSSVGVCSWLKHISCVEVTCESKTGWKPPLEVYRVHKVCNEIAVPPLETVHFEAGTPPERGFKWASPPPASSGQVSATR
jgi:SAM-dependent methyltransferase